MLTGKVVLIKKIKKGKYCFSLLGIQNWSSCRKTLKEAIFDSKLIYNDINHFIYNGKAV